MSSQNAITVRWNDQDWPSYKSQFWLNGLDDPLMESSCVSSFSRSPKQTCREIVVLRFSHVTFREITVLRSSRVTCREIVVLRSSRVTCKRLYCWGPHVSRVERLYCWGPHVSRVERLYCWGPHVVTWRGMWVSPPCLPATSYRPI